MATGLATGLNRRAPGWLVGIAVMLTAMLLACIPRWRHPLFYFWGDNSDSFFPLWHYFGQQLRQGQWPSMDPGGWMGGNYAAEAAYGIFNPVTMGNSVLVSFFDDLSTGTFLVVVEFVGLLALGVYLLAREYGAARGPAAIVGVAAPFAGFTLFYETGNWASGLMAFTWLLHFWWSARRLSRGRLNPLVPFAFGLLTITTGNPYGMLAIAVVGLAIAMETLLRRQFRRLVHLLVLALCLAGVAVLVYGPLLLTLPVTVRARLTDVVAAAEGPTPDDYLVPDWGDIAGLSTPTYRPSMQAWFDSMDHVPSTYLAWFLVPLLPWLAWGALRKKLLAMTSLLVVGAFYLTVTLGPATFWLFRWPLRVIEYSYVAVLVLVAVALTAGVRRNHVLLRLTLSVGLVVGGGWLAVAGEPGNAQLHQVGTAVVLVLVVVCVLAAWRWRTRGLVVSLVAGTAVVLGGQAEMFWWNSPYNAPVETFHNIATPHDLTAMRRTAEPYRGTVLQIASTDAPITAQDMESGRFMFGNIPAAVGVPMINRYTGVGYWPFASEFGMDYHGGVYDSGYERLWPPLGPPSTAPLGNAYDISIADALRVSTVVLQNSFAPRDERAAAPGWRLEGDEVRTVFVRTEPLRYPGTVSWTSPGTTVAVPSSGPHAEELRVSAPEGGGRVMLARLAWPGYTAAVDGVPTPLLDNAPFGLVMLAVPPGEHTVRLSYYTPGLARGLAALAAAVALAVLHGMAYAVLAAARRRRRAAETFPELLHSPIGDGDWLLDRHRRVEVGVSLHPVGPAVLERTPEPR